MEMYRVLLTVAVICLMLPNPGSLWAQSQGKSLEICGVSFHLGMSREEVRGKFIRRPVIDQQVATMMDKGVVLVNSLMLGSERDEQCYGSLLLEQDRVVQIGKTLGSYRDAVSLVRALFNQVKEFTGKHKEWAAGQVLTWDYNEADPKLQMAIQSINVSFFGNKSISVSVEEARGKVLEDLGFPRIGGAAVLRVVLRDVK